MQPFEKVLGRLEEIVQQLERGELPLEESLRLFEEGIALARRLDAQLGDAEMKVEQLVRSARGEHAVPLDLPSEEP
ncbi:MAG: exodeoxyribonuclease VII small subunit [Acidobacteria bacterium]|nr:exodeoxyribonuclease VII small subunit [Acidobacteriota bacterium]